MPPAPMFIRGGVQSGKLLERNYRAGGGLDLPSNPREKRARTLAGKKETGAARVQQRDLPAVWSVIMCPLMAAS